MRFGRVLKGPFHNPNPFTLTINPLTLPPAAWCAGQHALKLAQGSLMRSGGAAAALLPLPADVALTAAARLGSEMLGTAVLLVGAQLPKPQNPEPLPADVTLIAAARLGSEMLGTAVPPCGLRACAACAVRGACQRP